jgi:hypothetical protein
LRVVCRGSVFGVAATGGDFEADGGAGIGPTADAGVAGDTDDAGAGLGVGCDAGGVASLRDDDDDDDDDEDNDDDDKGG